MNPQTQAEAKRIMAVIDDLLEDLTILSHLPAYHSAIPNKDMQHLLEAFHDEMGAREVQQQLHEHYELERRLETASADVSPDDVEDVHFSTRALIDTLRFAGYPKEYVPAYAPATNVVNFHSIFTTMRDLLYDHLNTTMEDEVIKITILNDTVHREQSANVDVQALGRDLVQERETRKVEVEKREIQIEKFKDDIKTVSEVGAAEETAEKAAHAEQFESNKDHFKALLEEKDRLVAETTEALEKKRAECTERELQMRLRRTKKENEVNAIISTYDEEMTKHTSVIKEALKEKDEMEKKLEEIKKVVDALKEEEDRYSKEKELEKERMIHSGTIALENEDHAKIIQAFYRSHAVRVHMAMKGKKKGKKK